MTGDWEDGDSCWGFFQDDDSKYFDLDAERSYDDSVEWFADDDTYIVGKEYQVPEFVVTRVHDGVRFFLSSYVGEETWTADKSKALKFPSWWKVQSVAQDVIPKEQYNYKENCVEIDEL